MGCIDYSSKFYAMVGRKKDTLPADQFKTWLEDKFNTDSVEMILKAIENGDWNSNFSKETVKTVVTVTPNKDYSDEGFFINKDSDRSTFSYYGVEFSGGRIAHNQMINTFKKAIIGKLIYDYETKTSVDATEILPNGVIAVNQILLDYRVELMKKLWEALNIKRNFEYTNDKDLTRLYVETLQNFERELRINPNLQKYYDTYVTLKNFDNLINTHFDIVSVNKAFKNSDIIGRDMYEYSGPSMKRDNSIGKESADADDYTGSIVKTLLNDYFPEVNDQGKDSSVLKIGLVGFNRVMTHVIEWLEDSGNQDLTNEFNKGASCNWGKILDEFDRATKKEKGVYMSILRSKLKGIRKHIFSETANLPYDIINSFNRHVRDVYSQNYSEYALKRDKTGNSIQNAVSNDYFIEVQTENMKRIIQAKVDLFRSNPKEFERFCFDHDIEVKNDEIIINKDGIRDHLAPAKLKLVFGDRRYTINEENVAYETNDAAVASLIEDLFDFVIPHNYSELARLTNSKDLYHVFRDAIAITIAAGSNKFKDFKYKWDRQLDVYPYTSDIEHAGKFFSYVYGGETLNVVKNREGNNLPMYSVGSAVRRIKRTLRKYNRFEEHAYSENPFIRNESLLGKVINRSEVQVNSNIKASKDNTISEIATVEIVHDFYENLMNNRGVVWMQPICYSDKSTHTMFELDLNNDYISNNKVSELLKEIARGNTSRANLIIDRVYRERKYKTAYLATEMLNRYGRVFAWEYGDPKWLSDLDSESSPEVIKEGWENLRKQLNQIGNVDELRKMFKRYNMSSNPHVDLIEEFDFGTGTDGKLDINWMLWDDLETYVFGNTFRDKIDKQIRLTAQDLWEQGWFISGANHKAVKENFITDGNRKWYDPVNRFVRPFIIYDRNNNEVKVSANSNFASYFTDTNYTVELNPIVLSQFYMKLLYGTPMKELLLGSTHAYKAKVKFKGDKNNPDDIAKFKREVRASKIVEETKRALWCGATTTTYLQGLDYGVPRVANVACVDDLKGVVSNPRGDIDSLDVHDGGGWVSPYWAIQTNESLADASVGWNKKTIYGYTDPDTGVFTEIKWAEFALSNAYRKMCPYNNDFSIEQMFKKMHSKKIPEMVLKNISLSDYYSTSESVDSEKKQGKLTHQRPVYFFDTKNGKYYEIINIESNGRDVIRTLWEVNEKGRRIGTAFDDKEPIIVNSIYDLDQLFGGAFCKEKDESGYLVDSNTNNYIVNNIICENNHLKDYMIHIVANKSAIKVGQKNLNTSKEIEDKFGNKRKISPFSIENNDELQTFTISTESGGVIMDADHDIENSEVREMGQLVSALIQEGNSAEEAKEIYKEIGEVVFGNVGDYIKAIDKEDKSELYNLLGDALLQAFATQERDVIGLAQAFISKFEQGNQKYQIPFSSATIAPAFMSAVSSVLTKKGIRRTFPGVGAVQVPSRGVMKTFVVDGVAYDYEGLVKYLRDNNYGIESENQIEHLFNDNNPETNPFVVPINSNEVEIEDSIIIEKTYIVDGNPVVNRELIVIDDLHKRDYYRHFYSGMIYRHGLKPRELTPPDTTFVVNGVKHSIYDLDAVRKCNYLTHVLSDKASNEDILNYSTIFADPQEFLSIVNDKRALSNILTVYQKEADNMLKLLSARQKLGAGEFPNQFAFGVEGDKVLVEDIKTSSGQIIMGKAYAEKLGINKYYNIADIKERGPWFFEDEIMASMTLPSVDVKYDAVAYMNDGTKVLIVLGDGISAAEKLENTVVDTTFRDVNGKIWKNYDEEICDASDIECRKCTKNGKDYSIFVIKSMDVLDKIKGSKLIHSIRYNYNMDNVLDLMLYEHDAILNEDGTLSTPLDLVFEIKTIDPYTNKPIGTDKFDLDVDKVQNKEELVYRLRQDELGRFKKNVKVLTHKKWEAFNKSTHFIGTRIPAQSMQSFMPLEVVCFTNSELNDVYVPHTLTWVAGSDYDIDKLYMMGYSLNDFGVLQTYSDLDGKYDAEQVLKLPIPKGRTFVESVNSGNIVTFEELSNFIHNDDLSGIIRILNTDITRLSFIPPISGMNEKKFNIWKRRFIRTLNRHEKTKLSDEAKTNALKNKIVSQIENVMTDPINMINMLYPVSMDKAREAGEKTVLGARDKYMDYDSPTSMMIMQYQNMLGKNVIGSAASSLKAYFSELTYYNDVVGHIAELIKNGASHQVVFNEFKKIVFDSKYGTENLRILSNTPLQKLIDILPDSYKTLVLDDISYNEKMQGKLSVYIDKESKTLNLAQMLDDLNKQAWEINTAEEISEILSCATDNAKELILAKINATLDFSDVYTYLITTGTSIREIADFMTSEAFNVVSRFTKTNMFNTSDKYSNLEKAIDFVLDDGNLPHAPSTFNSMLNEFARSLKIKGVDPSILMAINTGDLKNGILTLLRIDSNVRDSLVKWLEKKCSDTKPYGAGYNEWGDEIYDDMPDESYDPDDAPIVVKRSTYTDYVDAYNYVQLYLNPKNEIISTMDFKDITEKLNHLKKNIVPGVNEQKIIASFFGINKGIQTKDWDEYNWIEKQNKHINKIYRNSNIPNLVKFDFVEFVSNEKYRQEQIKQMDRCKHTFNVLEVITKVDHFWEMLKLVGINRKLIENAAVYKLERNLEKEVLGKSSTLSKADEYSISQKGWKELSNYARDVITMNWFLRQSELTINIDEGWEYYRKTMSKIRKTPSIYEPSEQGKKEIIHLNTQEGIATFKRVVENNIVPMLKRDPDFKNNMFIQQLRLNGTGDTKNEEFKRKLAFPFPLTNIEKGSTFEALYNDIVKSFNKDMYVDIGTKYGIGSWSLGDLFFVYNLVVNKEGFGKSSMTKIFEDCINYGADIPTANSYYTFIKLLDSKIVPLNNLKYNIKDLKMRFANTPDGYKVNAQVDPTEKVYTVDNLKIPMTGRNVSDFTFNMWEFGSESMEVPKLEGVSLTNFNKLYEPSLDNKEVVSTIVETMVNTLGGFSKVPVRVITTADIHEMKRTGLMNFDSGLTFSDTVNAHSFIYNGVVYINSDHALLESPIHELFHVICAGMKYSRKKAVRELYYKILRDTAEDTSPYYKELGNAYINKHGSDLKEEVLVRALADKFKNEFSTTWSRLTTDESGNTKSLYSHGLKNAIIETINQTLGTNIPQNIKEDELGNYTLEQALVIFKSKLFELDRDWLTKTSLSHNQTIATIKDRLIKNEDLIIGENC